mgnify:FL=1
MLKFGFAMGMSMFACVAIDHELQESIFGHLLLDALRIHKMTSWNAGIICPLSRRLDPHLDAAMLRC